MRPLFLPELQIVTDTADISVLKMTGETPEVCSDKRKPREKKERKRERKKREKREKERKREREKREKE